MEILIIVLGVLDLIGGAVCLFMSFSPLDSGLLAAGIVSILNGAVFLYLGNLGIRVSALERRFPKKEKAKEAVAKKDLVPEESSSAETHQLADMNVGEPIKLAEDIQIGNTLYRKGLYGIIIAIEDESHYRVRFPEDDVPEAVIEKDLIRSYFD